MSPDRVVKHTLFYSIAVLSLQTIAVGILGYIGSQTIPFVSDYFKTKELEHQERHLLIAKVDTLIAFQKEHAYADWVHNSMDSIWRINDVADKAQIIKRQDGMEDVQISMLTTISSIQYRMGSELHRP